MAQSKKPPAADEPTVAGATLAHLFNVTLRRVQQLANDGVIPRPLSRGRYRLEESVRGYVVWLQERVQHRDAANFTRDLREEQVRKARLENEAAEGLLVSRADMQVVVTEAGAHLSQALDALSGRLVPHLGPLLRDGVSTSLVAGIIDDEQRRVRTELADRLEAAGDAGGLRKKRAAKKAAPRRSMGRRREATA